VFSLTGPRRRSVHVGAKLKYGASTWVPVTHVQVVATADARRVQRVDAEGSDLASELLDVAVFAGQRHLKIQTHLVLLRNQLENTSERVFECSSMYFLEFAVRVTQVDVSGPFVDVLACSGGLLTACISVSSLWYLIMVLLSFSFSVLSSSCSFLFSFSFLCTPVSMLRWPPRTVSLLFITSANLLMALGRKTTRRYSSSEIYLGIQ